MRQCKQRKWGGFLKSSGLYVSALVAMGLQFPSAAYAKWLEASSAHFVIYAEGTERSIAQYSEQLERYHAGMAFLLKSDEPIPSPSNRVTIYIVRDKDEVRQLYGSQSRYVGGFYIPRAGGSLAILPTIEVGRGDLPMSMVVLLHEYAHHFMVSNNAYAMPRWFLEGAAEFFASSKFERDGSVWFGRPAQHRAGELFLAKDVKVSDLLDPTQYEKRKSKAYDAFYGKSWLLYHYLTFAPERAGQLEKYVISLQAGVDQKVAAAQAFGDWDILEKDIDTYLTQRKLAAIKLPPEIVPTGQITIRTLSEGEGAMMPVRIASKSGVDKESAVKVLEDARKISLLYPGDPALLTALAEAEFDAGHDVEAIAAADAALNLDPKQVNAYLQKGFALMRTAEQADDKAKAYRAVRQTFVALNKLENDHPLPLINVYRSYVAQGIEPPQLALAGLQRALELAPFDKGLRLELGNVFLGLRQGENAKIVLKPLANDPHRNNLSEYARKVLDRLEQEPNWNGVWESGETAPLDEPESD